jgi:hypothetical protein
MYTPNEPFVHPVAPHTIADSTCKIAYQDVEIHNSLSWILVNPRYVAPSNETMAAAIIRRWVQSTLLMGSNNVVDSGGTQDDKQEER